jgi:hydroxymethylpyrimidine pyrophosphatase-like HAD family hydrolase
VADEITTSNEDDGIAVVLERLFPHGSRPVVP